MPSFKFPWSGSRDDDRNHNAAPQPWRGGSYGAATKAAPAARAAIAAESVQDMRRRARNRLIGAAVLVVLGVIAFPLLFDTQPRPIPVDVPIAVPERDAAQPVAPLVLAEADKDSAAASASPSAPVAAPPPPIVPKPAEKPSDKAAKPTAKAEAKDSKPQATKAEAKPDPKADLKPGPQNAKAEAKPEPKPAANDKSEAERARALLEGRSLPPALASLTPAPSAPAPTASSAAQNTAAAPAASTRFIVQVGAFADMVKANEARRKLEAAGLKTYTQTVDTANGPRFRVRLGPFPTRAEADRAAAQVILLGMSGSVLAL